MSSDNPKKPEEVIDKPLIDWDVVALKVAKGVVIMAIRGSMVAVIAISLAVMVPAVGLAEQPEVMQEVEVQLEIEAEQEGLSEEEKKGFRAWAGSVVKKAAAGAGDLKDKLLDVDEKMADKIDTQAETIKRLRMELVQARTEAAESRYTAGVKHEMMLQCGADLLDYLKALPKD